jgi:plastocyanin
VIGGVALRLTQNLALVGDAGWLVGVDSLRTGLGEVDTGAPAWSVGIHARIPYTPHTLSVHASNAGTTTVQGASIPMDDVRWGFEFTVPITLSRYFGGRSGTPAAGAPAGSSTAAPSAAVVEMDNRLRYLPETVTVRVGETVTWRNTSDVVHTVTADPAKAARASSVALPDGAGAFDSGDLSPGEAFSHTFRTPGTYRYFCIPHELAGMVGTVIVEGPSGGGAAGP